MSPVFGHIGLYTPFFVLVYFVSVRAVHRYEQRMLNEYTEASSERYPQVTLKKAITSFSLAAAAVVAAGTWLPFVAKDIAELMGWGQSFVGTLLVAAVTSAPEIVVTVSALRIGALDMAIANVLGSNLFNIVYLAVDDLFYTKGSLLASVDSSHAITAFTSVMMSTLVIVGFIFRPQKRAILKLTWISLGLFLLYILNAWIQFQYGQ
jgi:cation:H+ antiporter